MMKLCAALKAPVQDNYRIECVWSRCGFTICCKCSLYPYTLIGVY